MQSTATLRRIRLKIHLLYHYTRRDVSQRATQGYTVKRDWQIPSNFEVFKGSQTDESISKMQGSTHTKQLRNRIGNCNDTSQIVSILKNEISNTSRKNMTTTTTIDVSVFGRSMQQCNYLKDIESTLTIFKLMMKHNVQPSVVTYNILFDGLIHLSENELLMQQIGTQILLKNKKTHAKSNANINITLELCLKYLKKMIKQDNILPNAIIFTTLLRGCRFQLNMSEPVLDITGNALVFDDNDNDNEKDEDEATDNDKLDANGMVLQYVKKLENMIFKKHKDHVECDVLLVSELIRIYVKCYKHNEAYSYWKFMIEMIVNGNFNLSQNKQNFKQIVTQLKPANEKNITEELNNKIPMRKIFYKPFMSANTDLLNGLSTIGDLKRCETIWNVLNSRQLFNIKGDKVLYNCLMKLYLHKNIMKPNKAIKLFDETMGIKSNFNIRPDYKNFYLKQLALLKCIEKYNGNKLDSQYYYNILMNNICKERIDCGLKEMDTKLARIQWKGSLLMYPNSKDWKKYVLPLFDKLYKDEKIGISTMVDELNNTFMIDFNECEYKQEVSFLIQYVLINMQTELKGKDMLIIIGKTDDQEEEKNVSVVAPKRYSNLFEHSLQNKQRLKVFIEQEIEYLFTKDGLTDGVVVESNIVSDVSSCIVKIDKKWIDILIDYFNENEFR